MNSVNSNKDVSAFEVSHFDDQRLSETIVKGVISELGESSIETLKRGGLTSNQLDNIHDRLKQMAIKLQQQFGNSCDLSDLKVQEFIKTQFTSLFSTIEEIVRSQAPDLIRKASLSEAVFSHKDDYHPILATDSLATCIGVAGYDSMNKFGFVIHFTSENEIKASGAMLLDRIRAYREQNTNAHLLIHLRGGIKGMSEPLLTKVKEWLTSTDLNIIIASEDTLQSPIFPGVGIPKVPGSIKLDVRTGTCETYDSKINPYSNEKKKDISELNSNFMVELFVQVATKKPEIRIVYDSKG